MDWMWVMEIIPGTSMDKNQGGFRNGIQVDTGIKFCTFRNEIHKVFFFYFEKYAG